MRGYAAHTLGYAPHTLGYAGLLQVRVFTCNPLHNHFYPQRRPQYHHARSQQDFRRPRGRRGPMGHGRQGRSPTSPAPSAPTLGSPARRTSTRPPSATLGLAQSPPPAPSLGQCVMFRGGALPLNTFGGGVFARRVGGGFSSRGGGRGHARARAGHGSHGGIRNAPEESSMGAGRVQVRDRQGPAERRKIID